MKKLEFIPTREELSEKETEFQLFLAEKTGSNKALNRLIGKVRKHEQDRN